MRASAASRPRLALARFLRAEEGSISVEAILIFPLLCWCYMAMFVFFDAFAAQDTNVKATYTIGDILSRQTDYVTPEFMDSLYSLQDTLTATPEPTAMRVTAIRYFASNNSYRVVWSQVRGPRATVMTNTALAAMRSRIPTMADQEVAVLVETWMKYTPPLTVAIDPLTFQESVVTRPRFALNGRFCWNSLNDGGTPATEIC